jgi:molecular chaperone GrpE (heat shock protein)
VERALWLLELRDYLEAATAYAPQPDPDHAGWQLPAYPWIEQIGRARGMIDEALINLRVRPSAYEGQTYDPEWHTTDDHDTHPDLPPRRVIRVTRQGFGLGSRVLRKARVLTGP